MRRGVSEGRRGSWYADADDDKVEKKGRKQTRMKSKERKVTEGGWAR